MSRLAQDINDLDIRLKKTRLAQDALDLDNQLEIVLEGLSKVSPLPGDIGIPARPTFQWTDPDHRGLYEVTYSLNSDYSNGTTVEVFDETSPEIYSYTPDSDLPSGDYFWKVEAFTIVDRPPIVDEAPVTGMTLWDSQTSLPPIYVYNQGGEGAYPLVLEGATELSNYMVQSSGKSAPSLTSVDETFPFPTRCIKVGFPNNFTEREEYQIKCSSGGPIEITGKDQFNRSFPDYVDQRTETDYMEEAGTYNATMAFIRQQLGVVFAWVGNKGTAVPQRSELTIPVFEEQRNPSCSVRNHLRFCQPGNQSGYAINRGIQKRRGCFYSLNPNIGHELRTIYDRFHPDGASGGSLDNLKYFALQPDGSRSGFPAGPDPNDNTQIAKVEVGEPLFDQFFIDNYIEYGLDQAAGTGTPQRKVFSVAMNDSFNRGHSVDNRAKSMDYPDRGLAKAGSTDTQIIISDINVRLSANEHAGKKIRIIEGTNVGEERTIDSNTEDTIVVSSAFPLPIDETSFYEVQEADAEKVTTIYEGTTISDYYISDREARFAKRVLEKVQENPEYSDFYIMTSAYGHTAPAPKRTTLPDKIMILNVSNEFSNPDSIFKGTTKYSELFDDWLAVHPKNQIWRPNTGQGLRHPDGLWLSQIQRLGARFKTLVSNGCCGFVPDTFWEHNATQWTVYYLFAELMWDHTQDVNDIMDNAYSTLFGAASTEIKNYYELVESIQDDNKIHAAGYGSIPDIYTNTVLNQMQFHINNAKNAVSTGTDEHDRILFLEAGFNWCAGYVQSCRYFVQYNDTAEVVDPENLAQQANAIEDDTNSASGWTKSFGITPPIQVIPGETEGNSFAFLLDGNDGNTTSKTYSRDVPLPSGDTISGTATSGDSTSLTDTSLALTDNTQIDRVIRITAGTNAGQERAIISNTADTFVVEPQFLNPIDSTDEYEIVDLYKITFLAKHIGTGGAWQFNRGGLAEVLVQPDETEFQEYEFVAYGGDFLEIRDSSAPDRDGGVHVESLTIEKSVPVNKQAIADEWVPHNNATQAPFEEGGEWHVDPPIGYAATRPGRIPGPNSSDYVEPPEGYE